jgi:CO dehydrogenase maturation factor
LAALLIRALRETRIRPILAVDADPNSNLADALGVPQGRPLAEIREQGSSQEGSPASGIGRARALEDEIQRAITEAEGFDLVTMGRPEGPRCYCYVNNLLRKSLDGLARNYAAVVLDNEAGMEHLSRRTTNNVDFLIAVTDPTLPAFRAVQRILGLVGELPIQIGRSMVLVNRAGAMPTSPWARDEHGHEDVAMPPDPLGGRLAELGAERLPDVPQDDAVQRAANGGCDVFTLPAESAALAAVHRVLHLLYNR